MEYKIEIQGQRYKPHQAVSLHLITAFTLLGLGAFTLLLGQADWVRTLFSRAVVSPVWIGSSLMLYAFLVLYFLFFWRSLVLSSAGSRLLRLFHLVFALAAALLFLWSKWWLAASVGGILVPANILAIVVERKARQALFVVFRADKILLPPTARRNELAWHEVQRVLLRHGTLTIDCVNNVLYQWTIRYKASDADEFEAFCAAQIHGAEHRRINDDW